ncbi:MspA family porin [Nocardia sp. NPDC005998]|uniref:MspA family porin n=1 Tax=Nocardia sp. NPDC005998 TaxID=3156894 RepID=UPI0033B69582
MYRKCVLIAALTMVGCAVTTAPFAHAAAAHEKTYSVSGTMQFTVGQRDIDAHPLTALNGMPTNREVLLDTDFYGRISGSDSGTLTSGYYVACAVDLDPKAELQTKLQADANLDLGLDISPGSLTPSIDINVIPDLSGGLGADLSMSPGKIADITVGTKKLQSDTLGTMVSRDFHIQVSGCGGALTIRAYARVTAESAAVDASGASYGDPIVL